MVSQQSRLRLAEDVTFQSLGAGEDTVLLSLDTGYLYTCNETTGSFLKAIDGRRTFAHIVSMLAEQYDVPMERLEADLQGLVEELLREKLIMATGRAARGRQEC